jgi:hypothetical protein
MLDAEVIIVVMEATRMAKLGERANHVSVSGRTWMFGNE